ncbi:MAG: SAM-dependent methyltransferase [Phycicoccus sp.]
MNRVQEEFVMTGSGPSGDPADAGRGGLTSVDLDDETRVEAPAASGEGADGDLDPGANEQRPSIVRVYDYALGGRDNFTVDREMFEQISRTFPEYRQWAVANRGFMARAVRFMASSGIRQFVDLGAGLPTSPSVHEVAQSIHPDAAVVYVDRDPVVAAYGRAHFTQNPQVAVLQADLCDPDAIWASRAVTDSIRTSEPVGLLLVAALHFVEHSTSLEVLARYRSLLPAGSQIAISLVCRDPAVTELIEQNLRPDETSSIEARLNLNLVLRMPAEVDELFAGLDLVEPGLVPVTSWRSDDEDPAPMASSRSAVVQL